MKKPEYTYKIKSVDRIVDGDTVDLTLELGFSVSLSFRFRLTGFDAPETFRPMNEAEKTAGKQVTNYLKLLLAKYNSSDHTLYVQSYKMGAYGRYNGTLYKEINGEYHCINDEILQYMVENKLTKEDVR